MGKNFRETLNAQMKNPDLKKEWDNLEIEFQIINEIITARNEMKLTQTDLSKITGIAQGDISKIENGNANPSIKTLKKIAKGLNKEIKFSFEPIKQQ